MPKSMADGRWSMAETGQIDELKINQLPTVNGHLNPSLYIILYFPLIMTCL